MIYRLVIMTNRKKKKLEVMKYCPAIFLNIAQVYESLVVKLSITRISSY